MLPKYYDKIGYRVDIDQTAPYHSGLHCLISPACLNIKIKIVQNMLGIVWIQTVGHSYCIAEWFALDQKK